MGWKQFCAENEFHDGDKLKFEFINVDVNNTVNAENAK